MAEPDLYMIIGDQNRIETEMPFDVKVAERAVKDGRLCILCALQPSTVIDNIANELDDVEDEFGARKGIVVGVKNIDERGGYWTGKPYFQSHYPPEYSPLSREGTGIENFRSPFHSIHDIMAQLVETYRHFIENPWP
jgi:hypothetical protein